MRGISFEIPNRHGRQLLDILQGIYVAQWNWEVGAGESYSIENGELGNDLLCSSTKLTGTELLKIISGSDYYLIFVDLKAYPNDQVDMKVETYDDFLQSDCQFVFLLVDSMYVTIYSKDQSIIQSLFERATNLEYNNVEYITDGNDERTTLIAF